MSDVGSGHIVNLASNDVHRFDLVRSWFYTIFLCECVFQALVFIHFMWLSPLHILVYTVLTYLEIGPAAILGTVLLIAVILIQIGLARLYTKLRFVSTKRLLYFDGYLSSRVKN